MNAGQNPKLILIGHFASQTSEADFGYLKEHTDSDASGIFIQLEETDEIQLFAKSLWELLSILSEDDGGKKNKKDSSKGSWIFRLFHKW